MSKPTAKPASAAKEETPVAMPPKSRKLLVVSIILLLVIVVGGTAWFLTEGHAPVEAHVEVEKSQSAHGAKFVPLGEIFKVNLQREEGDHSLQAGITLKILKPELEEEIKAMMPEIRNKLLFLISSKKPSELLTVEGKKQLIAEIIAETDAVLGLGSAPAIAAPAHEGATHMEAAASAPAAPQTALVIAPKTGIVDVLFTSFFIQ